RERRPTIKERDGEIIRVPRSQTAQSAELRIGESGERASQKIDLRANAVSDLRQPRPIEDLARHDRGDSLAAAAVVQFCWHYLPPPSLRVKSPRSAKFGSFSSRAISSRSMARNPLVRPFVAGRPCR